MINALQYLIDRVKGKAPKGARRSPKWRDVSAEHLKKFPRCYVCKRTTKLKVHHVVPFHYDRDLELEPGNLLTLCESKKNGCNCHLLVGHGGDYREFNPNVRRDGDYVRSLIHSVKYVRRG